MSTIKSELEMLLIGVVLANGVSKQARLVDVREYIQKTPSIQLKKEIAQITSLDLLRLLQAAGVPSGLQDVFFQTFDLLGKR